MHFDFPDSITHYPLLAKVHSTVYSALYGFVLDSYSASLSVKISWCHSNIEEPKRNFDCRKPGARSHLYARIFVSFALRYTLIVFLPMPKHGAVTFIVHCTFSCNHWLRCFLIDKYVSLSWYPSMGKGTVLALQVSLTCFDLNLQLLNSLTAVLLCYSFARPFLRYIYIFIFLVNPHASP